MENSIVIPVEIKMDTYVKISKVIQYANLKNELRNNGKPTDFEIQEFISGCINTYLKYIEEFQKLSGYDDLGKPFRLKNRFKELMDKRRLKQKNICDVTEIAPPIISRVLANENQPSLDYFLRLWVFFGCPSLTEVLYREE
jgi:hypothetical protein